MRHAYSDEELNTLEEKLGTAHAASIASQRRFRTFLNAGLPEYMALRISWGGFDSVAEVAQTTDRDLMTRIPHYGPAKVQRIRQYIPYQPDTAPCPHCAGTGQVAAKLAPPTTSEASS